MPFRTAAGTPPRPADVVNLAFVGTAEAITRAFTDAGWSTASALSLRVDVKSFLAIAAREGYRIAPVSVETLDGRVPDLVFQKQTNTFARRHHIRLWRRDTVDGVPFWVAAATHDIGVKFVVDEHSFTHRVERDIDLERAKITGDLRFAGAAPVYVVDRPGEPHTMINATEDTMTTDAGLTVIRVGAGSPDPL